MIDLRRPFLEKALESLTGAESETASGRFNNCANRCYYACFQAAIAALTGSGVSAPGAHRQWSHSFVPAQFVGQLINRRKLYPPSMRDTLSRTYLLRQTADYAEDGVTRIEAERALRRAREFVSAIDEKVREEGT
jgi:uncharacterized protein (UPF0332 family)